MWSPAGGHKGRPYDMEWPDGACGMLPGYRAACLASPEKFAGADAHILSMLRNPEVVKPANPANAHIELDGEE